MQDSRPDPQKIDFTLRNFGQSASGIGARLEPFGWFAVATRIEAAFPDLAPGATATSATPHYAVAVDAATPPGHKLGFVLRWSAAEGSGVKLPDLPPRGRARVHRRRRVRTSSRDR